MVHSLGWGPARSCAFPPQISWVWGGRQEESSQSGSGAVDEGGRAGNGAGNEPS